MIPIRSAAHIARRSDSGLPPEMEMTPRPLRPEAHERGAKVVYAAGMMSPLRRPLPMPHAVRG